MVQTKEDKRNLTDIASMRHFKIDWKKRQTFLRIMSKRSSTALESHTSAAPPD